MKQDGKESNTEYISKQIITAGNWGTFSLGTSGKLSGTHFQAVPPESSETGMCIHQFLPATGGEQLQNASSWNCRVSHTAAQPALAAAACPQAESQVCAVQEHTGTGSVMWDGQRLLLT